MVKGLVKFTKKAIKKQFFVDIQNCKIARFLTDHTSTYQIF